MVIGNFVGEPREKDCDGGSGTGHVRKVADRERVSKRPFSMMVDAWAWEEVEVESMKETFATAPLQLRMQIPMWRRKAKSATPLTMSPSGAGDLNLGGLRGVVGFAGHVDGLLGLVFGVHGRPFGLLPALVWAAPLLQVYTP
ncbi:hypothetical protein AAC387_Pa03g2433 [Persea americana]